MYANKVPCRLGSGIPLAFLTPRVALDIFDVSILTPFVLNSIGISEYALSNDEILDPPLNIALHSKTPRILICVDFH